MENLRKIISAHPFFGDFDSEHLDTVVGCAKNMVFHQGDMIFRAGQKADQFYLIKHGRVALEIYVPHRDPLIIDTVVDGNVLGWSWLFPPYRWHFDARALDLTRAVALDGKCLRRKKEKDHQLGYKLMSRFAQVIEEDLQATRLQLIDLYQNPAEMKSR